MHFISHRAALWRLSFLTLTLLCARTVCGQKPVQVRVSCGDADGLVNVNDTVQFSAVVQNQTDKPLSGKIRWVVHTVAFDPSESLATTAQLAAGEKKTLTFDLQFRAHGFADVECGFQADGQEKVVSHRSRIGAQPEAIEVPLTNEDDFDAFWSRSLAELAEVNPEFSLTPKTPKQLADDIELYEVSMRSFGNVRVRGWLEIPKSDKPLPVVIRVPGYGQSMKPIGRTDMIVFSFNTRAHGNSQQDVPGNPQDYWIRGLDDKDMYFYRGSYLDCVRAVDFVCSRSEVDKTKIAVWGGSQGGGFALATAALDPRIRMCVTDIPFLCDWVNYFKLTHWPEMNKWIAAKESRTWESTLRTMSYFDTMNLAQRIRCRTIMGVGLQDQVCPPTTCFAAFNRIAGKKTFRVYPKNGHWVGNEHYQWVWKQVRGEFGIEP